MLFLRNVSRFTSHGSLDGLFEQLAAPFPSHNSNQQRLVHIRFSPDAAPLLAARVWLFGEGE